MPTARPGLDPRGGPSPKQAWTNEGAVALDSTAATPWNFFFFSSPEATTGEIAIWHFREGQSSSVVWGTDGARRQGVLLTVGDPRLLRRGSGGQIFRSRPPIITR